MKIILKTANQSIVGAFNSSLAAKEIIRHLPVESSVSLWGNELYFNLGFKASAENSTMDVEAGDIAYWPQGKCLCVFFGPTPQSITQKPIPASPVVIVGKITTSLENLQQIQLGEKITVSRLNESG